MSDAVYVIGVGMTPFGRLRTHSVKELTDAAVRAALSDASASLPDIEAAFFGNVSQGALEGQHAIRGQIALRSSGLEGISIFNVENACATGSTAFHMAHAYLRSGLASVVLAIGAEKMVSDDKLATQHLFDGGWDVHDVDRSKQRLTELSSGLRAGDGDEYGPRSVFVDVLAALARRHMTLFGTTERQIAQVASKNHEHARHNPNAQFRAPISVDEVLNARTVAWPLTVPMCSPISDGAAAVLLCREEVLHRFNRSRAVRVRASVLISAVERTLDDLDRQVGRVAALAAYEAAGAEPADISVAEVHDASAFGEIAQSENLGFFPYGEGAAAAVRGETSLGGRIPINTSGGMVSRGHPLGATGLAQIHELVTQLRGEAGPRQVADAMLAVQENGGGFIGYDEATCAVNILEKPHKETIQ